MFVFVNGNTSVEFAIKLMTLFFSSSLATKMTHNAVEDITLDPHLPFPDSVGGIFPGPATTYNFILFIYLFIYFGFLYFILQVWPVQLGKTAFQYLPGY